MTVLRWILLLIAFVLLVPGLCTVFPVPHWIGWQQRLAVTGLIGETGYRYLLVPAVITILAAALPNRKTWLAVTSFGCGLLALTLWSKPLVQAWAIGAAMPARLTAAFGPGTVDRAPFSLRGLYASLPESVPYNDGLYRKNRGIEISRAIGRSPAPCVIVVHGGGWFGNGFVDRRPFNLWLARHGYCVATIAYSSLPKARWPEPRDDVLFALRVLREHAAEFGIDPHKFILLGRSAGAQLALTAAYSAHDPDIRGVVAFYGPTDFRVQSPPQFGYDRVKGYTLREIVKMLLGGTQDSAKAAYESASAMALADRQSPPTLLIHGALDTMVPVEQSEELAQKLSSLGRPNALLEIPWASHSFDTINVNGPGGQLTTYAVARFLDAVTR